MKRYALMAAVAAALGTGSLLYAEQETGQTGQQPAPQQVQPGQDASGREGQTGQQGQAGQQGQQNAQEATKHFVTKAYSTNQFEIQSGQKVAEQAQDPQIKQYAQRIVKEHQQANEKLKQAAQQAGIEVQDKLSPPCQAMLDEMSKLKGEELTRSWLFHQVGAHQSGLLENLYYSQHAQNPQIKQYAREQAQAMQQHLENAQQLAQAQVRGDQPRMMGQPAGREGEKWQPGQPGQPGQTGEQGQTGQPGQTGQDRTQPQTGQPGQAGEQGKTGETGRTGEQGGTPNR